MRNKGFVNLDNARLEDQKKAMERIKERNECPFCRKNLEKEHKEEILIEGEHWLVTKNQWKYKEAKNHILLIAQKHVVSLRELDPEAWASLRPYILWIENKFGVTSEGVGFRTGNTKYNGATVSHFHVHFMEPKRPEETKNYEPIKFYIGARV